MDFSNSGLPLASKSSAVMVAVWIPLFWTAVRDVVRVDTEALVGPATHVAVKELVSGTDAWVQPNNKRKKAMTHMA